MFATMIGHRCTKNPYAAHIATPRVNTHCVISEIPSVLFSRIIFMAWGTQQSVVQAAATLPMDSTPALTNESRLWRAYPHPSCGRRTPMMDKPGAATDNTHENNWFSSCALTSLFMFFENRSNGGDETINSEMRTKYAVTPTMRAGDSPTPVQISGADARRYCAPQPRDRHSIAPLGD
jgi:hypothetical protein